MASSNNIEKRTDIMVTEWIKAIGIEADYQGSSILEVDDALKGASKSENGNGKGHPEFVFVSDYHLFVVENKVDNSKLEYSENGEVNTDFPYRQNYAVNGAVHYAKHIVEKSNYKEAIAIGVTGNPESYYIQPYLVTRDEVRKLDDLKSFQDFSKDDIKEYWEVAIEGKPPRIERELQEIKQVAEKLHEDLRDYGNLESEHKASLISALLLALEEPSFDIQELKGHDRDGARDGDKILSAIKTFLEGLKLTDSRPMKYGVLLQTFQFIQHHTTLNTVNPRLGKTPLHYYADELNKKVVHLAKSTHDFDILGNFYGEFAKYSGGDGNGLGIVLTPRHITSLMSELIDVRAHDFMLDPCCGSGAFLISGMQRMLEGATDSVEKDVKANRLYGIELQQKLYSIATTNMILRQDGRSNLYLSDMFQIDQMLSVDERKPFKDQIFTKILMNPPYSQGKKGPKKLSEINFIKEGLKFMKPGTGSKLAAIVPQSTMVGNSKEEKQYKKLILDENTLEAVITLNKDTFYGVGVNPCICIFTAGIPHNFGKKLVKFIDFSDDGYIVRKHIGLTGNGTEKSKREHLIDVINDNAEDNSKFVIKTLIEPDDEWLHSFYYFNDEIPSEADFEKTIADYLTFQFDMYAHGRGYLFEEGDDNE
jgi:type I restriction-modification system DNA methylase subunit